MRAQPVQVYVGPDEVAVAVVVGDDLAPGCGDGAPEIGVATGDDVEVAVKGMGALDQLPALRIELAGAVYPARGAKNRP